MYLFSFSLLGILYNHVSAIEESGCANRYSTSKNNLMLNASCGRTNLIDDDALWMQHTVIYYSSMISEHHFD